MYSSNLAETTVKVSQSTKLHVFMAILPSDFTTFCKIAATAIHEKVIHWHSYVNNSSTTSNSFGRFKACLVLKQLRASPILD